MDVQRRPVPPSATAEKYPLGDLQVGECASFPRARESGVRTAINRWQNHPEYIGRRFTTRVEGDLITVWRTA